jgi:hypothetical protein
MEAGVVDESCKSANKNKNEWKRQRRQVEEEETVIQRNKINF